MLLDYLGFWETPPAPTEETGGYSWDGWRRRKKRKLPVLEQAPLPVFEAELDIVYTFELTDFMATTVVRAAMDNTLTLESGGRAAPGVSGTLDGAHSIGGDAAAVQAFPAEAMWGYGTEIAGTAVLGFRASADQSVELKFKSRDPQINEEREILMLLGLL